MGHALIIDDNIIVSRSIQRCLEQSGFRSFDHTWTEEQALEAADRRRPDIIIIGDTIEAGSAVDAARQISLNSDIPVIMVSGDPTRAAKCLAKVSSYDGPFVLNDMEKAVQVALAQPPSMH